MVSGSVRLPPPMADDVKQVFAPTSAPTSPPVQPDDMPDQCSTTMWPSRSCASVPPPPPEQPDDVPDQGRPTMLPTRSCASAPPPPPVQTDDMPDQCLPTVMPSRSCDAVGGVPGDVCARDGLLGSRAGAEQELTGPRTGDTHHGDSLQDDLGEKSLASEEVVAQDAAVGFETFNAGYLVLLKKRLQTTTAWVVCAQETGILQHMVGEVGAWAGSRGWHMLGVPAKPGIKGTSCGTAVFVRKELGLRYLPGHSSAEVLPQFPHRCAGVAVDIPGWPPIAVYSLYLVSGGMSQDNLKVLADLGPRLHTDMLTVVAADWQSEPDVVVQTGFVHRAGLVIAAPQTKTCFMPGTTNKIDYFAVSPNVAQVLKRTDVAAAHAPKPHKPVQMIFRADAVEVQQLVYYSHERLPVVPPFGPQPRPQPWQASRVLAAEAAGKAKFLPIPAAHKLLNDAYTKWVNTAETEIASITGVWPKVSGKKSLPPTARWAPVLHRPKKAGMAEAISDGWKWIYEQLRAAEHLRNKASNSVAALENEDAPDPRLEFEAHVTAAISEAMPGEGLHPQLDAAKTSLHTLLKQMLDEGPETDDSSQIEREFFRDSLVEEMEFAKQAAGEERKESWQEWQDNAFKGSARGMHRYSKLQADWKPTTVMRGGHTTADPSALLDAEVDTLKHFWRAENLPEEAWVPDRECYDRASALEVRQASRAFTAHTSQSLDGIHPRQVSLLPDVALEALAFIFQAVEALAMFPACLWWMLFPMLEKPKGGFRPVLLCAGPVRVWQRLRRACLADFNRSSSRVYWGLSAGKAPQEAVWLQAARAEASVGLGLVSGGMLWDAAKYYESFDLRLLRRRALLAGIPRVLVKVSYNLWRGPRLVRLAAIYSKELLFARSGLPAGDIFNDAFVKAYALEPFDRFVVRNPRVKLLSFVDDDTITANGLPGQVLEDLGCAGEDFHRVLCDELKLGLAKDKLMTVGSDWRFTQRLHSRLNPAFAGTPSLAAVNLGVDFSPGVYRSAKRAAQKRNQRMASLVLRHRKLKRIRKLLTRQSSKLSKIYVMGALPSAAYGAAVQGMSDAELYRVRQTMLQATTPRRGASMPLRLAVWGDPVLEPALAPAMMWVDFLWKASCARTADAAQATVKELRELWLAAAPESSNDTWRCSRGPLRRAVLSLKRAGWSAKDPFVWEDDRGLEVKLADHSPAMIKYLLCESMQRAHEKDACTQLFGTQEGQRICVDHVRTWYLNSTKRTSQQKFFARAVTTGVVFTRERLRLMGYATDGLCEHCGAKDTLHHRLWKCTHGPIVRLREKSHRHFYENWRWRRRTISHGLQGFSSPRMSAVA